MKQMIIRAVPALILGLGLAASFASADPIKGEKILNRAIHDDCVLTAPKLASQHTLAEWEALFKAGKMEDEVQKLCKREKPIKPFNPKYAQHVFEYMEHYANDSGAIPA